MKKIDYLFIIILIFYTYTGLFQLLSKFELGKYVFAVLLATSIFLFAMSKSRLQFHLGFLAYTSHAILTLLSIMVHRNGSMDRVIDIFYIMIIMFSVVYLAKNKDTSKSTIKIFLISYVFVVLFVIFEWMFEGSMIYYMRADGLYNNPNGAAHVILLGYLVLLTRIPKKYQLVFIIISSISIFLTGSRAGILLLLISIILQSLVKIISKKQFVTIVFLILGVSTIYNLVINSSFSDLSLLVSRFLSLFGQEEIQGDNRLVLFIDGINTFAQRPFLGYGMDYVYSMLYGIRPHNQFLDLLLMFGLLGLIPAVLIFAYMVNSILKSRSLVRKNLIIISIIYFLLHFFTHNLYVSIHYAVPVFLSFEFLSIDQEEVK